jgi:hypothetical protein
MSRLQHSRGLPGRTCEIVASILGSLLRRRVTLPQTQDTLHLTTPTKAVRAETRRTNARNEQTTIGIEPGLVY